MVDEVKLLGCPFCEGIKLRPNTDWGEWWITCQSCETHGPSAVSEAEAIAAWNTRAPTPSEWRERVARIIDPEAWVELDQRRLETKPYTGVIRLSAKLLIEPSLAKADAIASLGGVQDRSSE